MEKSEKFHGPGHSYMHDYSTPYTPGIVRNNAKQITTKTRTDGFCERLAKVQKCIAPNHSHYRISSQGASKSMD